MIILVLLSNIKIEETSSHNTCLQSNVYQILLFAYTLHQIKYNNKNSSITFCMFAWDPVLFALLVVNTSLRQTPIHATKLSEELSSGVPFPPAICLRYGGWQSMVAELVWQQDLKRSDNFQWFQSVSLGLLRWNCMNVSVCA